MLLLTILLVFVAVPAFFAISAFLGFEPFDERIGITSYTEVMRLRASAAAVSAGANSDAFACEDDGSSFSTQELQTQPLNSADGRFANARNAGRSARRARHVRHCGENSRHLGHRDSLFPGGGNN